MMPWRPLPVCLDLTLSDVQLSAKRATTSGECDVMVPDRRMNPRGRAGKHPTTSRLNIALPVTTIALSNGIADRTIMVIWVRSRNRI